MFYQKLDYLMRLTSTSNTSLAKQMDVVPSYISKIRSGKRKMPKNAEFMEKMCACFMPKLRGELLEEFSAVVGNSYSSDLRYTQLDSMLSAWLNDDSPASATYLAQPKSTMLPRSMAYTGENGLREGFMRMLRLLEDCEKGSTVFLYSEKVLSELLSDHSFFKLFKGVIYSAVERGVQLNIINPTDSKPQYFIKSADIFTPLMASGLVDAYFYPHFVDGMFQHTLFIISGKAVLAGFDKSEWLESAAAVLHTGADEIRAHEEMFDKLLHQCKRYNNKFSSEEKALFEVHLTGLSSRMKDYTTLTSSPTAITFPFSLYKELFSSQTLFDYSETLEESLKSCVYYEQFCLPDIDLIKEGRLRVPLSEISSGENVQYTPELFRAHLMNILRIAEEFHNYQPRVRKDSSLPYCVYAKTNTRVVIARWNDASSYCLLPARESHKYMDYIHYLEERGECWDRETSLELISEYIKRLQ